MNKIIRYERVKCRQLTTLLCSHALCYHIFCTYLSGYFLGAPREYVHPGLVLGLDWTSCQHSSTCIFLVFLVPTIHVSHVHPPLTTRQLNTNIQVNNMAMLHLINNRHTYVHHIIITIQYFLHTSSTLSGRPAGLDPSCREQYQYTLYCWSMQQ
jgi:hypothetical protein